jgi:hypothetical protein
MLSLPSRLVPCTLAAVASAVGASAHSALPFAESSAVPQAIQPLAYAAGFAQDPEGAAQGGQIVITEFMKDPSSVLDTRGEWIEVYNAMPWRVNLEGWVLSDDSGAQHVISTGGAGLRVAPGAYLVLGNNGDTTLNGGVNLDYVYSGFVLGNGADQIVLSKANGQLVDRVSYDDGVNWPDMSGQSISLRLSARTAVFNDNPMNWCHSSTPISTTNPDTGTPDVDNDACP